MKVFVYILLFCFFVFDSVAFYFLFENNIRAARSEAKERMHLSTELVTLKIPRESASLLTWTDGHEFRYENKMYDVVDAADNGNEVVYTCYQDKKEEGILSFLSDHLKSKTDAPVSGNTTDLHQHLLDKYVSKQVLLVIHQQFIFSSGTGYFMKPDEVRYLRVLTPPPNII